MKILKKINLQGYVKTILFIFVSVLLIFILVQSRQSPIESIIAQKPTNYSKVTSYFVERIAEVGPQKTHDEMVAFALSNDKSGNHFLAHALGAALYKSGGPEYLSYCGSGEFGFGCYHQVLGMSMSEYGTHMLDTLKEVCLKTGIQGGCAHGIGHSLTASFGYEFPDVKKAANSCLTIYKEEDPRLVSSCSGGVFMEYNLREIATAEEGASSFLYREYTPEDPYNPCADITNDSQATCIYELPRWWIGVLSHSNSKDLFAQLGDLCRALPDSLRPFLDACFVGVGYAVSSSGGSDLNNELSLCSAAGHTSRERELCLSEVAHRYYFKKRLYLLNVPPCEAFGFSGDGNLCEKIVNQALYYRTNPSLID
jgi:hypothetical protein